jgi:DNA-binding transcriptional ArsR family regulator
MVALGDRTRRAILACLAERPRAVGELADELPVSRPAVSQHLKVLKDAGLVTEHAAGTRRIYRLNRPERLRCAISSTPSGSERWPATTTSSNKRQRRGHDSSSGRSGPQPRRRRGADRAGIQRVQRAFRRFQAARAQPARCGNRRDRVRSEGRRPHLRSRCRRQRVSLGTHPRLRATGTGRIQLGDQPAMAARDRAGKCQRGRGPVHRRRPATHPPGTGTPSHRPARPRLAGRPRRRRRRRRMALYLDRYAALFTAGS